MSHRGPYTKLRALLILGRVSNLPTVWSNCLAGWLLGGGSYGDAFLVLCLGASCLYIGGMFLNDAFDVDFDRQHRPERPIPSAAISLPEAWLWGLGWVIAGLITLSVFGETTALLAALLSLNILVYDAMHKLFAFSPILMGTARCLLVLVAASTGFSGLTGLSIWSALVMGAYVAGLSFLARKERRVGPPEYWPFLILLAPFLLALIVNRGEYLFRGLLLSGVLLVWCLRSLWTGYWSAHPSVGRAVSSLLAGIILVDLLAVAPRDPMIILSFVLLFVSTLMLQRFIPAT